MIGKRILLTSAFRPKGVKVVTVTGVEWKSNGAELTVETVYLPYNPKETLRISDHKIAKLSEFKVGEHHGTWL